MHRLTAIPEYVDLFRAAFPGTPTNALTFDHAARALAVFQMDAFTRTGSPFDRFLDRDDGAMTAEQKQGAQLFFGRAQCSSCHNGPFLGGNSFANVGAPQVGPGGTREPPLDLGRGELDNNEFYRFAFRVAPLRNVELTAPYMHSGAYPTLEAVVNHYDNVPLAQRTYDVSQLPAALRSQHHGDARSVNAVLATLDGRFRAPLDLNDDEKRALVSFLKALTDPAAKNLGAVAPTRVPSGLPVN
jgi:cytochrome c peroxidase